MSPSQGLAALSGPPSYAVFSRKAKEKAFKRRVEVGGKGRGGCENVCMKG
jgi:hypothetical protein